MCLTGIWVSLLQRVTLQKRQSNQSAFAPSYGLRFAPVLLRGHAATGHPWPIAALPASMPVDPLHRTSSRPPGRAGRSKTLRPEAADRPACSVRVYCAISVAAAEERRLRSATKSSHKADKVLCQLNQVLIVYDCCGAVAHQTDRSLRSSAAATETTSSRFFRIFRTSLSIAGARGRRL